MKRFRLTAPKPYIPKEHDDQIAVFAYAELAGKQDERWKLLFATLNGVPLPIGLARKMKRAGNKAGVPDYILPVVDSAGCPGLFVEGKREKGGVVSDAQLWWHQKLSEQGYRVVVAHGYKPVIAAITQYLGRVRD